MCPLAQSCPDWKTLLSLCAVGRQLRKRRFSESKFFLILHKIKKKKKKEAAFTCLLGLPELQRGKNSTTPHVHQDSLGWRKLGMQSLTCPGRGQSLEGTSVHVSGEGPRIFLSPLPWGPWTWGQTCPLSVQRMRSPM